MRPSVGCQSHFDVKQLSEKTSKNGVKEVIKEVEEDIDDEDDALKDGNDPFKKHFELNIDSDTAEEVQKSENWTSSFEEWATLKRVKIDVPKVEVKKPKLLLLANEDSETELPNIAAVPKPPRRKNYSLDDYHILKPLKDNCVLVGNASASCPSGLTNLQKELLAIMSNYSDLYYPQANYEKYEEIRTVYAIHALNHVLKTRKRVLRHNSKLNKSMTKKKKKDPHQCFRDQGYTRPKVLIILPFKHSAYRLIEVISLLLQDKNFDILKQSRFREDFGPGENQDPPKNLNRAEDFHEIFKGNSKEDFKIGLKLTKRTIKLYSDFYQSDIIISSPLGLRCLMGNFHLSTAETDFLTSIEMLIIDQADVLMMQNWEHLLVLMEVLNKPPHDIHKLNTDITRIRMWTLDGHSSLYRQTLFFSATNIDHGRALVNKCKNFTGRVQVLNYVKDGSVQEVVVPAELVMIRVTGMRDPDSRFNYFVKEVLPQYQANRRMGILVYIPDYCDYVRLVKYLKEDGGTSFSSINEYMAGEMHKLAKIRSLFFDGKRQFLLYTERFHFYRRYRIKGVRHVIFYDLPTYPHFFSEICNLMVDGNQNRRTQKKHIGSNTVSVLYQQSDLTKVVGVLGSQRAGEIVKAQKSLHICVIGS
ncbi:U3 small nucleolar RNA-associated protein 25 homolog [Palaemon carinicauda]|uniref:U3 small nucleolar RNA-associated protein 25 homolog n=1 Tax=Palaemon carinicauda TaxID=392227 RepID=UPI0035B62304